MVLKVNNKKIADHLGSAKQFRIQSREVLYGIVEFISNQYKVEQEQLIQSEKEDINVTMLQELQSFGVEGELPLQFGSKDKKRRNNQHNKPIKKQKEELLHSIPPYDGTLIEHNMFKVVDSNKYCRVIGNGPSSPAGTFSMIQILNSQDTLEVNRFTKLIPLDVSELLQAGYKVEEDVEYRYNFGCPEGVHLKYWDQRYRLASKFDEGFVLDEESWYSITPERIGRQITQRCVQQSITKSITLGTVMDCFSGCGGNTIPFAYSKRVEKVIAIDFDQVKLNALITNVGIYGAASKVQVVCNDVYEVLESYLKEGLKEHLKQKLAKHYQQYGKNSITIQLPKVSTSSSSAAHTYFGDDNESEEKTPAIEPINSHESIISSEKVSLDVPDLIVMSPPWGGPDYCNNDIVYDLSTMLPCGDGFYLLALAAAVCKNVVYLVPKNVDDEQIEELKKFLQRPLIVENIYLNNSFKVKVIYVGSLFSK